MTADWVKEIPIMLSRYIKSPLVPLGTNGFGRADTREALRKHFEIDAEGIVIATLSQLSQEKKIDFSVVQKAMEKYNYMCIHMLMQFITLPSICVCLYIYYMCVHRKFHNSNYAYQN